jgi:hypothetical protein
MFAFHKLRTIPPSRLSIQVTLAFAKLLAIETQYSRCRNNELRIAGAE